MTRKNDETFSIQVDQRIEPEKRGGNSSEVQACNEGLFDHLRGLRKEQADLAGVPPYVIFADKTLRQMAAVMPERVVRRHPVPTTRLMPSLKKSKVTTASKPD